jgi:hypothetical protein
LVDLYNQGIPSSFTAAAIYSDSIRKLRVKLKKRSVSGGSDAYDASFTTITSDLINLGDIQTGIDDQEWVSGVTRSSLTIEMDNSNGLFNDRTDSGSYWHDSTSVTNYYIPNSLIEIDFGFELHTGTSYYDTFYSGLLRADSMSYTKKNTFKFKVSNKLEWLKSVNLYDTFTYRRTPNASGVSLTDRIYTYISNNAPSALSLTTIANSPRNDVLYDNIEKYNNTAFDFVSSLARQTGSIFGIDRNDQIYLTYFNNPNLQTTQTGLVSDSNTVAFYNFAENTNTADLTDGSGNGNVMSITGIASLTVGLFGNGRVFENSGAGRQHIEASITSLEAIINIHNLNTSANSNGYSFIEYGANSGFYTNELAFGMDGNNELNTDRYQFSAVDKTIFAGEDQWAYFAYTDNGSGTTFWWNGTKLLSTTATFGVAQTHAVAFMASLGDPISINASFGARVEFDSVKFSQVVLTDAEVTTQNAKIWGNKLDLLSVTSSYNFYNTGINKNIFDMAGYNNGFNKIYNKVIVKKDSFNNLFESKVMVDFNSTTGTDVTVNFGGESTSFLTQTSKTNFVNSFNSTYGKDILCSLQSLTSGIGQLTFQSTINNENADSIKRTNIDFSNTSALSISSEYKSDTSLIHFNKTNKQADYIFVNTASSDEYGSRWFSLDAKDNIADSLSQTTVLGNAILDDRKDPKIRMKLSTRFLEGNLDILNKITVNWSPDLNDLSQTAGGITWTSKDFWIIGYEHSWKNNSSNYTLREI